MTAANSPVCAVEELLQRREIDESELVRQRADRVGHAAVARGRADVPVLPAVIAAGGDAIAAGGRTRNAHAGRGRVRAVLAEPDHLGRRDDLLQQLGELDLELTREAVDDTLVELRTDRRIDVGVAVAEHDRQQTADEIDIFIAVDVPDPSAAPMA